MAKDKNGPSDSVSKSKKRPTPEEVIAILKSDGKHRYFLNIPFNFGEEEVVEYLDLKKPVTKDYWELPIGNLEKMTIGDTMTIVASIANEPVSKIKKMETDDIFELVTIVSSFLVGGQQIGS